jgi:glycosyltransferase 2 family protein
MKRKHAITTAVVVTILALLIFLQVRHWHNFDWATFRAVTSGVNIWSIIGAIALTWSCYLLRALRWSIFLRPTKHVPATRLIVPQVVGFTGLALLGRPGEFVRPYLIARREGLEFSSQLATWAVERVFDVASVALLIGVNLLVASAQGDPFAKSHFAQRTAIVMLALSVFMAIVMLGLWWKAAAVANLAERTLRPISKKFAESVCSKLRAFAEGIHTLKDGKAFLFVTIISLAIWLTVAGSYILVLHSYPESTVTAASTGLPQVGATIRLHHMHLPHVLMVMCASMFGSVIQLPGVGGGSQLAVISVLSRLFGQEPYNITNELALSCGMMLWLVTFMSVIPLGLILAHFNRISLRAIGQASEEDAEVEIAHPHAHDVKL